MSHVFNLKRFWVYGVALLCATPQAWALGMGQATQQTVLGSRLDVRIPVFGDLDEKIPPALSCIKPVVQMGEVQLHPKQLRTVLHPGRGETLYFVQIISDVGMNEPVVQLTLSLGCFSPLTKRFTLLIDPPGFSLGAAAATGSNESAERAQGKGPSNSSDAGLAQTTALATPSATTLKPIKKDAPRTSVRKRVRAGSRVGAATKNAGPSGPRLSLVAPQDSASAYSKSLAEAEADRGFRSQMALLGQLETMLKQISSENQNVRGTIAGIKDKLNAAELALQTERRRYGEQTQIVWALTGVICVMGVALLVLWLRRRQPLKSPFEASSSFSVNQPQGVPIPEVPTFEPKLSEVDTREQRTSPTSAPLTVVVSQPKPVSLDAKGGEVLVDDMVDIEQQADFFMALGEEQSAIDLLREYAKKMDRPLAVLKLLEIHRHQGDQTAFEQLRLQFHRRFNTRIPEWLATPGPARGLEDYPDILLQLESTWTKPEDALRYVLGILLRSDGQVSALELSAFRDLLMLFAVLKDLQSQRTVQTVDVELPLN